MDAATSIWKLNVDVLRLIFAAVGNVEPPRLVEKTSGSTGTRYELGWIRLAHVCSGWRIVLLDTGELWARDVAAIPAAFGASLARAGSWPLSFTLPSAYGRSQHVTLDFALRNIERTGSLSVPIFSSHIKPFLESRTLPLLRSLTATKHTIIEEDVGGNLRLDAPALRHVALTGISATLWAPRLVLLALTCLPDPPSLLLETLRSSPLLECLVIPVPGPWKEICRDSELYLPYLKALTMAARAGSDAVGLLQSIRAPYLEQVEIRFRQTVEADETLDTTMEALSPHLYRPTHDTIRVVEEPPELNPYTFAVVVSSSSRAAIQRRKNKELRMWWFDSRYGVPAELRTHIDDPYLALGARWSGSLVAVLRRIDAHRVQHLDLSSLCDVSSNEDGIRNTLYRFTRTRAIHVDSALASSFVSSLLRPAGSLLCDEGSAPVPFPELEEMVIRVSPQSISSTVEEEWWESLDSALARRTEAGVRRLRRLTVFEPLGAYNKTAADARRVVLAALASIRLRVTELIHEIVPEATDLET